jgi:hypothetical protein
MRAIRYGLLTALVALSGCDCGGQVQKGSGLMTLSPKGLDFDKSCPGETAEQPLLLANEGTFPFAITEVKVTGARFSLLEPLPATLDAGDQVAVRIGFNPPALDQPCGTEAERTACERDGGACNARGTCDFEDEYAGTIEITSDLDENNKLRATFIGSRFKGKRVQFRPVCEKSGGKGDFDLANDCLLLDFKDDPSTDKPLRAGTTRDRVLRLYNQGCAPLEVTEATFVENGPETPDDVKMFSIVNAQPLPVTVRGQQYVEYTVRFSPPARKDSTPGVDLRLRTTDGDKGEATVGMWAFAAAPSLDVDRTILTWSDAIAGQPSAKSFNLINSGGNDVTIDSIKLVADAGSTDFVLEAADAGPFTLAAFSQRAIKVTYTSSGAGGDSGKVVVTAGTDVLEVRLVGGTQPRLGVAWMEPPSTSEQPPPVDFGQTATGAKGLTRTLRLRSEGEAPVNVSKLEFSDDPGKSFSLGAFTPGPIPVGGSVDVTITFDDAVLLVDDTATLAITSDDPLDALNAGVRSVTVQSRNTENVNPQPVIDFCAHPPGSTTCQNVTRLGSTNDLPDLEFEVDASASTGPEAGDTLTFKWDLVAKPAGSQASVESPTAARTRLVSPGSTRLDAFGTYKVRVTVKDQFNNSRSLERTVPISP